MAIIQGTDCPPFFYWVRPFYIVNFGRFIDGKEKQKKMIMAIVIMEYRVPALFFLLFFYFLFSVQESLQTQQNGVEWTILSQGSRELEGLLKLVSKERLQLERNFVLATQVRHFLHHFILFFPTRRRPSLKDITFNVIAPAPYRTFAQSWGGGGIKKKASGQLTVGDRWTTTRKSFFFPHLIKINF